MNQRQKRFVEEIVIDPNATQAAIRAGYSKKTARSIGQRLLTNVDIKKEIQKARKRREKRTEIKQDRVLFELALIAFSDLRDYVDIDLDTGAIKAKGFEEMPTEVSRVLRAVKEDRVIKEDADGKKTTVYDKIKFELWDKMKALEMLGKHLGMFIEKIAVGGSEDLPPIKYVPIDGGPDEKKKEEEK